MGLFGNLFDFDGDGKTGFVDSLIAIEGFNLFNEYCDLQEKLKENQAELDRLSGKNKDDE